MPDYTLNNSGTITFTNSDGSNVQMDGRNIRFVNGSGIYSNSIYGNTILGADISRTEPEESKVRYIQQYNYNPEQFQLHKVNNEEELYLGIELEIDNGGEDETNAKYVYDFMNAANENVYCKHDGSLHNGFEIVTHPCTIEYHKLLQYEELFKELIKKGYRSHDVNTCGLHVHMNRNYFGEKKIEQDLNISKLLYLYEKFWDKVELIARRKSNNYARRFYLEEDESPLDLYVKSKDEGKYGAINLKHKDTIEIRIFKGTLNASTYFNTLEFVSIMAHTAKETDIYDIQFVTWDKIKDKFSENLNQYIIEREETVKKDDKEKVDEMISNRSSALSYASLGEPAPASYMYSRGSSLRASDFIYCPNLESDVESAREEMQRRAYEELARSARQMQMVNMPSFDTYTTTYNQQHELSEEEQIVRQIQSRRQLVRRSRNGLETTNLNRQIADLENQLRRLRRSNRNI